MGVLRVEWTSDSDGAVSQELPGFSGEICRVTTNPDGTSAPTNAYDITLPDLDGVDVALGTLADRHNSITQTVFPTAMGSEDALDFRMPTAGV